MHSQGASSRVYYCLIRLRGTRIDEMALSRLTSYGRLTKRQEHKTVLLTRIVGSEGEQREKSFRSGSKRFRTQWIQRM